MATATQGDRVYDALKNLKDLSDARELMSLLNYEYDSAPLRMGRLPDDTLAVMAGEPQIIARHGDFKVIHTQFKGQRLPLGHERKIIEGLLTDHPYSLFLFSDDNHADWHFVNVKHEGEKATKVFRRLSVGPDEKVAERLRTPAQQLASIALADTELTELETRPLEIQKRLDKAFDVEVVTRRFYSEYSKVFKIVEALIGGIEDSDRRRLFTQRLFNRLMFVAFVQKKGWLRLNGQTDYLNELWTHYQKNPDRSGFYNGRLKNLFFVALDNPDGRDYMTPGHPLLSVLGDVRYLNGGLFEQNETTGPMRSSFRTMPSRRS
jgi:hypothetical protein